MLHHFPTLLFAHWPFLNFDPFGSARNRLACPYAERVTMPRHVFDFVAECRRRYFLSVLLTHQSVKPMSPHRRSARCVNAHPFRERCPYDRRLFASSRKLLSDWIRRLPRGLSRSPNRPSEKVSLER